MAALNANVFGASVGGNLSNHLRASVTLLPLNLIALIVSYVRQFSV
jgi:hypothetical protein